MERYCETLLSIKDGDEAPFDVAGLTRQEYVQEIRRKVQEEYSKNTDFEETDFQSGNALLSIVNKHISEKNIFRTMKPDEEVRSLFNAAKKMLDEQAAGTDDIDCDTVCTAITHLLHIIVNSEICENREKADKRAVVSFETLDIDVEKAIGFLCESSGVRKDYDRLIKRKENASGIWKRIRLILGWGVIALLIAFGGIALSGLFLPLPQGKEDLSLLGRLEYWYRFDLMKERQRVSFADQWRGIAQTAGRMWLYLTGISGAAGISFIAGRKVFAKKDKCVVQAWNELQYLKDVFNVTAIRLKELEDWDDGGWS